MEDFVVEIEKHISKLGKDIQDAVDRFTQVDASKEGFSPRADVIDSVDSVDIYLDLPGLSKKDIRIKSNSGVLSIEGQRILATNGEMVKQERPFGAFARSFSLPKEAVQANITAKFTSGVLNINIPKSASANKDEIEIE